MFTASLLNSWPWAECFTGVTPLNVHNKNMRYRPLVNSFTDNKKRGLKKFWEILGKVRDKKYLIEKLEIRSILVFVWNWKREQQGTANEQDISLEVTQMFQLKLWWMFHNPINLLKITELYILNEKEFIGLNKSVRLLIIVWNSPSVIQLRNLTWN